MPVIDKLKFVVGIILIIYGFIKILIGSLSIALPKDTLEKINTIPGIGKLLSPDKTFTAMYLEIFLIIFGLYSIIHGLIMSKIITNARVVGIFDSNEFKYIINGVLGLCLTIFFFLVVYTDLPIDKEHDEIEKYKLVGFCCGLMFLLYLPVAYIYDTISVYGLKSFRNQPMAMLANIILIVIFGITLTIIYMNHFFGDKAVSLNDMISVVAVTLNLF